MCDSCGCDLTPDHSHDSKVIDVHQSLLAANTAMAEKNRVHIEKMGAVAINMISSPGSGKTTLLEKTIEAMKDRLRIGVIEGDIETDRDAARIRAKGVPVIQLTTGGACHLDAAQIHKGLHLLEKEPGGDQLDLLVIENVGNLVCPATFDLGEHHRVVLVSVPEGPDKPAKYPKAFISSQVFIISKTDLLPYFDFPVEEAKAEALQLNPNLLVMDLSATSGEGFEQWLHYLTTICQK
ncbi:MAG: hydrogenase nickel incorporation protein HypB [Proteobacteria bacterium]|nr:hydrogenase nickel incorporation protein HypB [Pseudomonadota bacterium]MBU1420302.1 hydrogenase nickel incorporation protein HypB [Pseudomonadota bacterium]MBU1455631.1 hydrogenase nickel incorporation protein HypB [Pseudomonadota bacterium]